MADRLAELQPRGMEALNSRPLVEAILKGMTPYYAEDTPPQMITPGMGPQKLQGTVAPNPLPWAAVDAASMLSGLGAKGAMAAAMSVKPSWTVRPSWIPAEKWLGALASKYVNELDYKTSRILEDWATRKNFPFEALDWQSMVNKHSAPLTLPDRAIEAGFNPNFAIFKGRGSGKESLGEMRDPSTKRSERGLFFAADPNIAADYGEPVTAYAVRAKNPAQIDWQQIPGVSDSGYTSEVMHPLIEAARRKKYDFLRVKNLDDVGGLQDQYVVIDPSLLRHPSAQFDPTRLNENNVLAGLAAMLGGIGALKAGDYRRD